MYWNNHRREAVERAKATLEFFFDIHPTMSERMFLKRYVLEVIDDIELISTREQSRSDYPDPILAGVGKFLMIHYDFRDIHKISSICYGETDNSVLRLLAEKSRKTN